jgi:hypothetical protein
MTVHPLENAGGGPIAPMSRLNRQAVAAAGNDTEILPRGVVSLGGYRDRRLLRDLRLVPTVPVPCAGVCRCWGAPLGGSA